MSSDGCGKTIICYTDRIISSINISIQPINNTRINRARCRTNEYSPLGGVIPGVAIIQAGVIVVIVATITNGVSFF